ncbi:acyl carrier protein [Zobellia laminariae]|uniref:Acyl carrier protein n=1 Tax=Zobellia barbeyronii TaxID=2748009 RepID=A0ABS5WIT0_9FLAO|nr:MULTISPECIES: acyl carrier protein [Zobellia]MBT2163311.1 acyl carrier protein [Zobellia barbeyronii]MUH41155.1 acyl carrier protein [Zobellia laminariae]WKX76560.1 acyl carrier protein [Zobellia laminariae]
MTREEILKGLIEILENTPQVDSSKLKNVTEKTDFITDLEVPSTELINVIAKAESKFDVEFDDDDIDDLGSSVSGTIDLIEAAFKNQ